MHWEREDTCLFLKKRLVCGTRDRLSSQQATLAGAPQEGPGSVQLGLITVHQRLGLEGRQGREVAVRQRSVSLSGSCLPEGVAEWTCSSLETSSGAW